MDFKAAACTRAGHRGENEDAFVVDRTRGLFAVADGIGGYEGGAVASRLAMVALSEAIAGHAPHGEDPMQTCALLGDGLRTANEQVRRRRRGRRACMGSTAASLLLRAETGVVGHIGDSRVYRLRGGAFERLTVDHSLGAHLAASGHDGVAYDHVLTRALGMEPVVSPDLRLLTVRPADVFLLCTDGLSGSVPEPWMARVAGAFSPAEASRALVSQAAALGATDDITALVVRACA